MECLTLYDINDAARILGRAPNTLRNLERQGRIPRARRDSAGRRYYTVPDLELLKRILYPDEEGAA